MEHRIAYGRKSMLRKQLASRWPPVVLGIAAGVVLAIRPLELFADGPFASSVELPILMTGLGVPLLCFAVSALRAVGVLDRWTSGGILVGAGAPQTWFALWTVGLYAPTPTPTYLPLVGGLLCLAAALLLLAPPPGQRA